MELNRIRVLKKEELLRLLTQKGFEEVANILENKDINGQLFIDLNEFDIYKFRLNPTQKKVVWNCLTEIKRNPQILVVVPQKPRLPKKPIAPITTTNLKTTDPAKKFKTDALKNTLAKGQGNVDQPSTMPISKSKSSITRGNSLGKVDISKHPVASKPLPPTPPPSLPARNNDISPKPPTPKSTNRKELQRPRSQSPIVGDYLEMHPPSDVQNTDEDYLTPLDIHPQLFENTASKLHFTKGDVHGGLSKAAVNEKTKRSNSINDLLNPTATTKWDNNGAKTMVRSTGDIKALVDGIHSQDPTPNSTSSTSRNQKKINLKDLPISIVNEAQPQTGSLFSRINIFKSRNKYATSPEQNSPKVRPLPTIPYSPEIQSSEPMMPIPPPPPPRSDTPDSLDNYLELTNELANVIEKSTAQHNADKSDSEMDIYENLPKAEAADEEDDEIYENLQNDAVDEEEQPFYGNLNDVHGHASPDPRKNKFEPMSNSTLPKKNVPERKFHANVNDNAQTVQHSPNVQSLAALLSEQLQLFQQKANNQDVINDQDVTDEDSEFEDDTCDLAIYGNVQDNQNNENTPYPRERNTVGSGAGNATSRYPGQSKDDISEADSNDLTFYGNIDGGASNAPKRYINTNDTVLTLPKRPLPQIPQGKSIADSSNLSSRRSFSSKDANNLKPVRSRNSDAPTYVDHAIKNSSPHGGESIQNNLRGEEFFRQVDRKGAKQLLSGFGGGAFLFRPSKTHHLVLSVKHNGRIFNFGITRDTDNLLQLISEGDMEAPKFATLEQFVEYFVRIPITFEYENGYIEIYLKKMMIP